MSVTSGISKSTIALSRHFTHSVESEVPEHTTGSARGHAAVLDLCRTGVAVHLRQLELGLGAGTLRKAGIADDVAERLSIKSENQILGSIAISEPGHAMVAISFQCRRGMSIPFGLHLRKCIALVVIPDQTSVNETREVKPLGVKH